MKKLLFAFPIIALLAAGCSSSQQTSLQTQAPTAQNPSPTPAQNQTTNNNAAPTSSADQISKDKIYEDQSYGFHLVIPQNYTNQAGNTVADGYYVQFFDGPYNSSNYNNPPGAFAVYISAVSHNSLDEYLKDAKYNRDYPAQTATTNLKLSGQQALKITMNKPIPHSEYWFIYNGNFYRLIKQQHITDSQFETVVNSFNLK